MSLDRFVRRPEVLEVTGLSRATIYRLVAQGDFPAPVRITTGNAVGWRESELREWMESRERAIEVPENGAPFDGEEHRRDAAQPPSEGEASDGGE